MPLDEVRGAAFLAGDEASIRPGVTYHEVHFDGLNLVEHELRGAAFFDCSFEECDLTCADLTDCTLRGVRFGGCRLRGVDLGVLHDDALGVEAAFERCDLDHLRAHELDLRSCRFFGGHAREAEFTRCDLRGVTFDQIDLRGARFQQCDLRRADLRHASGYLIDPATNGVRGLKVALPEALSFLRVLHLDVEA